MKIYMGGKIHKNDWRHALVPGLRGSLDNEAHPVSGRSPYTLEEWRPISFNLRGHSLYYVGPFFVSCDHGCAHGRGEHGNSVSSNNVCGQNVWGDKHDSILYARREVFRFCIQAIRVCDLFFVWLDQRDAYGTLVEIGIAHQLNKKICICSPPGFDMDDFWFAGQASEIGLFNSPSPEDGLFSSVIEWETAIAAYKNSNKPAPPPF